MDIDGKRRGAATTAIVFAAVVVIVAGSVALASGLGSAQNHSATTANSCFPPYLTSLASQVEANQRFISQQHGLSYVLATGDNESGTTGQVNGKAFSTPPDTALTFYSYGSELISVCPADFPSSTIMGVLWVHVPLNPNGSFNLSNMSVYFTPGLFTNSTARG